MKKRIVFIVGGSVLLIIIWMVSTGLYEKTETPLETQKGEQELKQEAPKKTPRLPRFKRFPADGKAKDRSLKKKDQAKTLIPYPQVRAQFKFHPLKVFKGKQGSYQLIENLRVAERSERSSYSADQVVEEKFGKLLVFDEPLEGDSSRVVQNRTTKRLAILTGVFKVKLHSHDEWSDVMSDYDLELVANYPGIHLSLLKLSDINQLNKKFGQLLDDPRVLRVELEILESPPVSR